MKSFTTHLIQLGADQVLNIPRELGLPEGSEVSVWRDPITQNIVISPAKSRNPLAELAAEIAALPEGSELMTKAEADALVKSIKFDSLLVD